MSGKAARGASIIRYVRITINYDKLLVLELAHSIIEISVPIVWRVSMHKTDDGLFNTRHAATGWNWHVFPSNSNLSRVKERNEREKKGEGSEKSIGISRKYYNLYSPRESSEPQLKLEISFRGTVVQLILPSFPVALG